MKESYENLYQNMLRDINQSWQLPQPDSEKSESCFWIAHDHWNRLKTWVRLHGFASEEAEIDFFRNTKPGFTAYIEYFITLSESLMFVPEEPVAERVFWDEERKRYERFVVKNKDFVDYYEKGSTEQDRLFFLRKSYHPESMPAVHYDTDLDFSTGFDQVLGSYLAFKKYLEYITCRKLLLQ